MMKMLKRLIPWYCKIVFKIILARLPVRHQSWRKLLIFQHGEMLDPEYAFNVFTWHFEKAPRKQSFTCLELGPGDSLFTALIARAFGAGKTYLVDVSDDAIRDLSIYRKMHAWLCRRGYALNMDFSSFENMLKSCGAVYLTRGLNSLAEKPDKSVDFIFSQVALEHVRKSDLFPTLKETRRIAAPGCRCSHQIDLRDHLADSLHSLRFSEKI